MDEKEWMMKPPNNWKSDKVVDALLKIDSDDTVSIGEALAPLDEYVASLENRIAELEGMIDEVIALDPLFPDELMDRLKGVE